MGGCKVALDDAPRGWVAQELLPGARDGGLRFECKLPTIP
jgi:hypothetical protein